MKTVRFADEKYVGDPLNAVRIFNEKQVDELFLADIEATTSRREPDYDLLSRCACECRMPLAYAGGVNRLDQLERIIGLGIEKVGIGSAAFLNPSLVTAAANRVGSQSVVAIVDVRTRSDSSGYEVCINRGQARTGIGPVEFSTRMQDAGAGEILLQSVDRDGAMMGYDLDLIRAVRACVKIPITVLGGAGSLADLEEVYAEHGAIGAAAGSLFVFKGKYRAVLITYPTLVEKDSLVRRALERFV